MTLTGVCEWPVLSCGIPEASFQSEFIDAYQLWLTAKYSGELADIYEK